jgi:hypothetical protein
VHAVDLGRRSAADSCGQHSACRRCDGEYAHLGKLTCPQVSVGHPSCIPPLCSSLIYRH